MAPPTSQPEIPGNHDNANLERNARRCEGTIRYSQQRVQSYDPARAAVSGSGAQEVQEQCNQPYPCFPIVVRIENSPIYDMVVPMFKTDYQAFDSV